MPNTHHAYLQSPADEEGNVRTEFIASGSATFCLTVALARVAKAEADYAYSCGVVILPVDRDVYFNG